MFYRVMLGDKGFEPMNTVIISFFSLIPLNKFNEINSRKKINLLIWLIELVEWIYLLVAPFIKKIKIFFNYGIVGYRFPAPPTIHSTTFNQSYSINQQKTTNWIMK